MRLVPVLLLLGWAASAEPQQIRLDWGESWTRYYESTTHKLYPEPPEGIEPLEEKGLWYLEVKLAPGRTLLAAVRTNPTAPQLWSVLSS